MLTEISDKLLSFQVAHTLQLYECLNQRNCVLDASDTGTGKTYCTSALCKLLNETPLIICPKSVINTWAEVCNIFGVKILGIANHEMLKSCKYYIVNGNILELAVCPFINKILVNNNTVDFIFNLPDGAIVVFDEAHRCKNYKTTTCRLLLSAHSTKKKIILLSATISDKIDCFKPFGVLFGFYKNLRNYKSWLCKEEQRYINNHDMSENQKKIAAIHRNLFPNHGSRMKIKELGNLFPQNNVIANAYYLDNYKAVDNLYEEINAAMLELKNKETRAQALGKIIRAKQRIELLKVPIFQDLVREAIDNHYSVVIFVNYIETMKQLCGLLGCDCVIRGGQTLEERAEAIERFQNNQVKILVAIITAGGVGVSLHDVYGDHPRMSIISPTWSGQDLVQCLGRVHRAKSLSHAIQKIVYCAKTYEEQICSIVKTKLKNISGINDGDMVGPKINVEQIGNLNSTVTDESYKYNF